MGSVAVGLVMVEPLAGTLLFLPTGTAVGTGVPDVALVTAADSVLRVCGIVADNEVWWVNDVSAEQEHIVEYHATYRLFGLHLQPNNSCSSSAPSKSNLLLSSVTFCLLHGVVVNGPSILHLSTVLAQ